MASKSIVPLGRRFFSVCQQCNSISLDAQVAPTSWENAMPFEKMPGPNGIPIVGNSWRFLPGIGNLRNLDFLGIQETLRSEFGNIVRLDQIPGREPWVLVMDPKIIEQIHRTEGPWPRRHSFPCFDFYKKYVRNDIFRGVGNSLLSQEKEWRDFRTKINPYVMRPQSIKKYMEPLQDVTSDLLMNIKGMRDENNMVSERFLSLLYNWAFESIGTITLGIRFGCLDANISENSRPQKLINVVYEIFKCIERLDMQTSLWRFVSTPTWRHFVRSMDEFFALSKQYINESLSEMKSVDEGDTRELSILQKMVLNFGETDTAASLISDFMFAGSITTGNSCAAAMYLLAKNPDKQERLYEELKRFMPDSKPQRITSQMLEEMKYLRACLKEAARLLPVSVINLRSVDSDNYILAGYRIPKDTVLYLCHMLLSNQEENFGQPNRFIPERWMKEPSAGVPSAKSAHPFVYQPFGFGARSCIGRRFAELETEILIAKIVRNFKLEYVGDLKTVKYVLHMFEGPLRFRMTDREA